MTDKFYRIKQAVQERRAKRYISKLIKNYEPPKIFKMAGLQVADYSPKEKARKEKGKIIIYVFSLSKAHPLHDYQITVAFDLTNAAGDFAISCRDKFDHKISIDFTDRLSRNLKYDLCSLNAYIDGVGLRAQTDSQNPRGACCHI